MGEVSEVLFNIDSEVALIGAAMYDPARCEVAFEMLRPEHFGDALLRDVWRVVLDIARGGGHPDPVVIGHRLGTHPGFEEWGGVRILVDILDAATTGAVRQHAEIVLDCAKRRRLIAVFEDLGPRLLNTAENTDDVYSDLSACLIEAAAEGPGLDLVSTEQAFEQLVTDLDAELETGIATGLAPLDLQLGPVGAGDMILLVGRPGMMKSGVGDNFALNVSAAGRGFIQVNLEMSVAQMTRRHISNLAHARFGRNAPTYKDIKRRHLDVSQRSMVTALREEFGRLPLKMVRRSGLTIDGLRGLIRRQSLIWARQGVELGGVSVDHVGLLRSGQKLSRYEEQTAVAIGLKQLAGEVNCPIFGLVQLNRNVEGRDNRRPQLHDLKDTGAWEENADAVIGLYREAYYALKEQEPKDDGKPGAMLKWSDWDKRRKSRELEAILLKVREGEEGTAKLWCSPGHDAVRAHEPDVWGA